MTLHIAILHGSNDLYGASRVLVSEVEALRELGHSVTVIAPVAGPLEEELRRLDVPLIVEPRLAVLRASRLRDVLRLPRLPTSIAAADVVVLWTLALAAYLPLLRLIGKPHWISVHELRPNRLAGLLVRTLLRYGHAPVEVVSNAVADWLQANGVRRQRLRVAPPVAPAVEREKARVDNRFVVAVAGRFNGRKGHLEVLKAFKSASEGSGDWELVLAGSPFGEDNSAVIAASEEAAGDSRIRIVGEVPNAASIRPVPNVYACFGDREEAFGLVPLEAWAIGARSAGFAEGGAEEVLPIVDGVLVPRSGNAIDAISSALKMMAAARTTWRPPTESTVHKVYGRDSRRSVVAGIIAEINSKRGRRS